MRYILEIIAAISLFIIGNWFAIDELRPELLGMSIGVVIALSIELLNWVYSKKKFIPLYWDCYKPFSRSEIRISIAYLFKIEDNGKYLLIRSKRLKNLFQPVGGVYKYFPDAETEIQKLGVTTDNKIANDPISRYDLRLKLKDKSKLPKFLSWFLSKQKRELDPWREFYEELVKDCHLSEEEFKYIGYELIGQDFTRIHFSEHFQIDEFLFADIYKPKFVNTQQQKIFENLRNSQHIDILWATEDEIKQERTVEGKTIAPHSKKIFNTDIL